MKKIIDVIINVLLFVAIVTVLFIAMKIVGAAKEPVFATYQQCDCNMTVYILKTAEATLIAMDEFDKKTKGGVFDEMEEKAKELKEEEKARKEAETLVAIFGYIPSNWEIELFLQFVQAECGNTEPEIGIERVAEVIINRVRSSRFPNTISGVLFQRGQFETYINGSYRCTPNERVRAAWERILSRGYCEDREVLFFTAGKYNAYCIPMYRIGNHYFGR